MSLSWGRRLRVGLGPRRVELVTLDWRGRAAASGTAYDCEPQADAPVWRPAVDRLQDALRESGRGTRQATVVLSNHFVRYVLVPWREEVTHPRERMALARHAFEAAYGEISRAWEIRLCDAEYGHPGIASGIDRELMIALRATFEATRVRLVSVQPLLMAAFNRVRGSLRPDGALALVEPERMGLAVFRGGHWAQLVTRRFAPGDIEPTVMRELASFSDTDPPGEIGVVFVGEDTSWPSESSVPARVLVASASNPTCPLAICAG